MRRRPFAALCRRTAPCALLRLPSLLIALALAACASDELFEAPEITAGGPEIPYETVFAGIEDDSLRALLEQSSRAVELEERPPATPTLLQRRGERDLDRLRAVLRSEGYYEAEIAVEVDVEADPARLTFRIEPGPPYRLESIEVIPAEGADAPEGLLPDAAALALAPGQRARAAEIVEAQEQILRRLQRRGHPYPEIAERRVVVDRRTQTVRVAYSVDPGRPARFGPTTITGLERVEEPHVRRMIPWEPGDPFDIRRFTELRTTLLETNLFATVQIRGAETVDPDGTLPITVELTERKRRTITAGISYQTEEGPGAEATWEHRNLFGRGEGLRLGAAVSSITLAAEAAFRKPMFRRRDQALLAELRVARDQPDAFTSDNVETRILIERTLRPGMLAAAGVGLKYAQIEDNTEDGDETEEFGLVFLPARFRWDTSDDLLDPSRGGRLAVNVAPFQDVLGNGVRFLRGDVSYTRYLELLENPRLILAGRGAVGSIVGAERDDIPADERFYVGGGGSLRGYGFQEAGDLDEDGDPLGGRSYLELNGELRVQATETLGFVVFLDAGSAYAAVTPELDERLLLGTGVGFRYFTPIGPLRFDVAVPVNPRDRDEDFQFYISLGQAF